MRRTSIGVMVGLSLHFTAAYAAEKQEIHSLSIKQLNINSHQLMKLKEHTDAQGQRHRRFQQYYEGVPVWGAYVSEHRSLHGETNTLGVLYNKLKEDLGEKPIPSEKFDALISSWQAKYPEDTILVRDVHLIVYVDKQGCAQWCWIVCIVVQKKDGSYETYYSIVNPRTYIAYETWSGLKTLSKTEGLGFGGNARIGKIEYGRDTQPLRLVRDEAKGECWMQNEFVMVQDMGSTYGGPAPISRFKCGWHAKSYWTGVGQDGYDEVNQAYSPINDALYIGTEIHRMFSDWYNLNPFGGSIDSPKTLVMRVHYGQAYENAFWDGKQMSFGDGGKTMYPLVVVSVAAHEIAHGLTEHHSDLVYTGQSGAINESFSDMAAQALEYYLYGKNSWAIAAEAMKGHTKALRDMKNPSSDGKSIGHAKEYYKGLDVHYASGVYNRFFYLLSNTKGWNTKKAFDSMLKANMDYWVPTSNYEDAACGVLWAAEDLMYPIADVKAAFKAVGIEATKCGVL